MNNIPLNEKYTLTIKEAAAYFNIGVRKCAVWQKNIPALSAFTAVIAIS